MGDNELDLKLTMKSIMMYEKLSGKSFSYFNAEEDIIQFMYCVFVCSTDVKITLEVFTSMLENKKFASKIEREFKRIWGYFTQFKGNGTGRVEENSGETELSITNYINTLVFQYNVSIDYCMNKMEIWELEALYQAAAEQMHSSMEEKRLWAFVQMMPNFDKKHRNITPDKFLPFPWEKENHQKKVEKELETETEKSKGILGMNLSELLKKPDNNEKSNIS